MTDAEKKPREFWLFESNGRRKNIAYVREAIGDYTTLPPSISSPWLRKIPPQKLIEHSAYQEAQDKIKQLEARVEKFRSFIEETHEIVTRIAVHDSLMDQYKREFLFESDRALKEDEERR